MFPWEFQPLGMASAQLLVVKSARALSSKLALFTVIAAPLAKPGAKIATQRAERILVPTERKKIEIVLFILVATKKVFLCRRKT